MLCQDLNAFGRLSCTKRAIQRISEEKGASATRRAGSFFLSGSQACVFWKTNTMVPSVITQDMSAYSADDDKILAVCRSKIEAMATRELFAKSATLTRMLGKEGVGDGEGIPEDVHRGENVIRTRLPVRNVAEIGPISHARRGASKSIIGRSQQLSAEGDLDITEIVVQVRRACMPTSGRT